MWGKESEQLERTRAQRQAQYAADLKRQMEESRNPISPQIRAAQQIIQQGSFRVDQQIPSKSTFKQQSEQMQLPREQKYDQIIDNYPIQKPQFQNDAMIHNMQYSIDRIISVEIPSRLKPYDDAINNLTSRIERQNNISTDALQALRDKFGEFQIGLSSIGQRSADNTEKIHSVMSDVNSNNVRIKEALDSVSSRIVVFDEKMNQMEEFIKDLTNRQANLERALTESIEALSHSITQIAKNSEAGDAHLMGQLDNLSRQTVVAVAQLGGSVQAVSDSVSSLSEEAKNSFVTIRDEFDSQLKEIEGIVETNSNNNLSSFEALQEEVIKTFASFREALAETSGALDGAVSEEIQKRRSFEGRLLEANDVFTVSIAGQLSAVSKEIDAIGASVSRKVESGCTQFLSTWKSDLSKFLSESASATADAQARVRGVEAKLAEYIVAVGKRQDEILGLISERKVAPYDDGELRQRIERLEAADVSARLSEKLAEPSYVPQPNNNNNIQQLLQPPGSSEGGEKPKYIPTPLNAPKEYAKPAVRLQPPKSVEAPITRQKQAEKSRDAPDEAPRDIALLSELSNANKLAALSPKKAPNFEADLPISEKADKSDSKIEDHTQNIENKIEKKEEEIVEEEVCKEVIEPEAAKPTKKKPARKIERKDATFVTVPNVQIEGDPAIPSQETPVYIDEPEPEPSARRPSATKKSPVRARPKPKLPHRRPPPKRTKAKDGEQSELNLALFQPAESLAEVDFFKMKEEDL